MEYLLWGLFGGFAVEGLEFAGAIRRSGKWPWKEPHEIVPLIVSVIIRLLVGGGLAAAAGAAQQINGPFGALAIGVAAPLIIEQLTSQISLTGATGGTLPLVGASAERAADPAGGGDAG
ncbi:hypothetical protein [Sphaerisporangium aureirubrum]|uniref:Uncharacterized protein n=1 Tax=Sphaerisporangium aureirubrum TaxID=1544736 RepID=A0ABW1NT41_9ACTN